MLNDWEKTRKQNEKSQRTDVEEVSKIEGQDAFFEKVVNFQKFCEENGNPVTFLEKGKYSFDFDKKQILDEKGEKYEIGKIDNSKKSEIDPNALVNPNDANFVNFYLDTFKAFIRGPIFSDKMKDHGKRFPWKEKNKDAMQKAGVFEFFRSNRMRKNSLAGILGPLTKMPDLIKDQTKKEAIYDLAKDLPEEFNREYNLNTDLESKLKFVLKLSNTLVGVLNILDEKIVK